MTFRFLWWQKVICWLAVLFVGRGLNLYQIVKYGFLPLKTLRSGLAIASGKTWNGLT